MELVNSIIAIIQFVLLTWLFYSTHNALVSNLSKSKARATQNSDGDADSFINAAMFMSLNE